MRPDLDAHLRHFVNFPSPPGVASEILRLAGQPQTDMDCVATAISRDPALSAKVLRIANSPLYAQLRRSSSLRQALVVLGLNATLTLALGFSLVKSLRGEKPQAVNHPHYWRRTLLAATAARALGEATGQTALEELFLCGLLQDLGMLALDRAVPELYVDTTELQRTHRELAAHEQGRLGMDHAEVGGWLLEQWHLPKRLSEAVAASHRHDHRRALNARDTFNRCVALSGAVADLFLAHPDQRLYREAAQQAERVFGLDAEQFAGVMERVGTMVPEAEALFETDLLTDAEQVVSEARAALRLRAFAQAALPHSAELAVLVPLRPSG